MMMRPDYIPKIGESGIKSVFQKKRLRLDV